MKLQRFVEGGGTLVTLTNASNLPLHFGLAPGVSERQASNLWAPGGVFRVNRSDAASPLAWGYGDELGVYFNQGHGPIFNDGRGRPGAQQTTEPDGSTTERRSGRGGIDEDDVVQAQGRDWGQESVAAYRARQEAEEAQAGGFGGGGQNADVRTVFRFASEPTELLISGGLTGARELVGSPALVDVRLGQGHVVMFSFNPFWRGGTLGSYALVFNALLHHGNLHVGQAVADDAEDR
jgi:hypothetical protein